MNFDDYQHLANRTSGNLDSPRDWRLIIAALGVTGEAGECADIVKKVVSHGHALEIDKLVIELGDLLWYIAESCSAIGVSMNCVAQRNIEKLEKRYPDGFSSERSINRVE